MTGTQWGLDTTGLGHKRLPSPPLPDTHTEKCFFNLRWNGSQTMANACFTLEWKKVIKNLKRSYAVSTFFSNNLHLWLGINRCYWGLQTQHRVGINQGGYRQCRGYCCGRSAGSPGCSARPLHHQPSTSKRLCPYGSEAWVSERVRRLK